MNTHFFSSAVSTIGRKVAPALLAASTLFGTLGFSSVASADERVVVAAPGPRVVVEPAVGGPIFVHRHRRVYVEPTYYGPTWFSGYGRGLGWGGYRGWGGFHGGGGGFHGGGRR